MAPAHRIDPAHRGNPAEPVPWLDENQQASWRAYVQGSTMLTEALNRRLESETGLSLTEYEIMVRLSESPGKRLRMSQLADELVHSRSRITYTIRGMESAGLVRRSTCPQDKRGVLCELTEAGWQRLQAAAPHHVASVRDYLIDALSADQLRELGQAMTAVTQRLRDRSGSPT